jgi:putative oxidoreductase
MNIMTLAVPVGRALIGVLFVLAGVGKIPGYGATLAYMAAFGVPGFLLPAVIALEIGGGLALITGLYARPAAALLAGFCILAAVVFHRDLADRAQLTLFLKDFAIAGGLLMLAASPPLGRPWWRRAAA